MTVVHQAMLGSLMRLALAVAVGSTLAFALGLLYPVQRELDLARYEHSSYQYEVEGVFPQPIATVVETAIGPHTCLLGVWLTVIRSGPHSIGPTEIDAASPACAQHTSRFPPVTMLAARATTGPAWIDLNADAARALHVRPGDSVGIQVGPDLPPVRLAVRGIYALRASGAAAAAMAPAELLFSRLPSGAQGGYGLALARTAPTQFLPRLAQNPLKNALEAAKGYPPVVTATSTRLEQASDTSTQSLGLVRTLGALAILGVAGLIVRELDAFRRECLPAVRLVHRLGGAAPRLLLCLLACASVVAISATVAGLLLAYAGYRHGVVASCFPPTLDGLLRWLSVGSAALPLGFLALAGLLMRHRLGLR